MLNEFHYSLPDHLDTAYTDLLNAAYRGGLVERIWNKDPTVWTDSGEEAWLGWLDIVKKEHRQLEKYKAFHDAVGSAGFEYVVLLGMGGSSLCPEVFALTFGKENFHILDSTVPARIQTLEKALDIEKTLFIVASKSGSTLEPNTFKQYFYERVADSVGQPKAGSHFVAITDPGSRLENEAARDGFWEVFHGEPTVGGRFSALSVFGLIPAAAMGIDVQRLLEGALEMIAECRELAADRNAGAMLGLLLGLCHRNGRDKLTIFTSPELFDLGAWLEQLLAESTGKEGVSIIPVDREAKLDAARYADDRVFAFLTLKGDERLDRFKFDLSDVGQPYVEIKLEDNLSIGQEFFRWEFATAVAGSVMGINPFDQPDVESAKIEARKITEAYEKSGRLPSDDPFLTEDGYSFFGDRELSGRVGQIKGAGTKEVVEAHLTRIRPHDYFAILAYVEMTSKNEEILQEIRAAVLRNYKVATCLGFGPRFLHSTGQAYKGGANQGVFLQITSDDAKDIDVPQQKYSFGVVKAAQSRGDFQVLLDRGRRALRIHMGAEVESDLLRLLETFESF
ncbi:MAG: bifunctional transaldolase/phosoglucose isomerase [Acidobacteriota bacterium]|nr:bifunctional transaldolase/phosoglucose isomerase [Acidobacteriota bacterium]MDH3528167.1 bifunctional transaldolase/phosoglucose isomerase [Acidobacteriota bacterium]